PAKDEQIKLLRLAFENENIGSLSAAWGRSWNRLENRFNSIQKLSVTERAIPDGKRVELTSSAGSIDGAKSDFMRFEFWSNLPSSAEVEIEISWVSEDGPGTARLHVSNGTKLVQRGLFPEWS